jgi:hypothetical protein
MAALLTVPLLLVLGFPAAWALTGRLSLGLLLAPLMTALLATVAVMAMLVTGVPMLWWFAIGYLAQAVVFLPRFRDRLVVRDGWVDAIWYVVPLIPGFFMVLLPPEGWDAHSIWWLHGAYFSQGAEATRAAIGHPGMFFSHTDYPPLHSAAVALVWSFTPADFAVAQGTSAIVTFSAIVALMHAVRTVTGIGSVRPVAARMAAVVIGLAAWATAPRAVVSGMSDVLWATTLVAGAVLLFIPYGPLRRPEIALFCVTVAALSKNEGYVAAFIVAALATLRERRSLRRGWAVWLPVLAGTAWAMIARYFGAANDLAADGHLAGLLRGDPAVLARLRPTLHSLWDHTGAVVTVALAIAVLGTLVLRRQRSQAGLGSDLWLWAAGAAYSGTLILTYLVSPFDVQWHLATSADRVSLPIVLLAGASAVCWGVLALASGAQPAARLSPITTEALPVQKQDEDDRETVDSDAGLQRGGAPR